MAETFMGAGDFDSMSLDELWSLHETLAKTLAERLSSEKATLEARLKQLHQPGSGARLVTRSATGDERRPYPAVAPKYRNPEDSNETWSGRGKQPRWLVALLQTGKQIDDFRIAPEPLAYPSIVTGLGRKTNNG
jgi:DNA-binding protein H-NS